ncbi:MULTISPECIES: hypothetical protein [Halobacteriovorax]|uniref:Lipoprotein n=1 Tax=Halobacteriovorax vibrionivorans TaxID=2152716 RepID=A0ABY0IC35_9BACT|nr:MULTISPECIES: hypothetical protein [Halobacteriovorax]AYF44448.1 putative lipoprotein [Halobacteriovorax sp. BALOs_7]RZF20511.1 hypothetical protein DAY19_11020 [Halobacteriovorax vibrionivorans]TGD47424.1 hypothetical protein EP118_07550 [Halobacteriovorax sp. Y22]
MKNFIFITTVLALTSCVAPRETRSIYDNGTAATGSTSNSTGGTIDIDDSSSSSNNGANIPSEIAHCKWSLDGQTGFENSNNQHLGPSTVCQSRTNETNIYIQVKNPDSNSRVCVIPTSEVSGNAIFLGAAQCKYISSSGTISKFVLSKNRDYGRYQNFRINSVMIMKEKTYDFPSPFDRELISYDAYFMCSINIDLYNDRTYCDAFKQLGEYYYKSF